MDVERLFVSAGSQNRLTLTDSRRLRGAPASNGSTDEYVGVLISIVGSRPRRLWTLLTLRGRIAFAAASLRRRGAKEVRVFVALPDLRDPTFLYEFGSAAAVYASRNLRLGHAGPRIARSILEVVIGCDAAAGTVLVVGRAQ